MKERLPLREAAEGAGIHHAYEALRKTDLHAE
jgi:hypothetical protein